MNITDFRKQYPQYEDLSDIQIARALHKEHYSDMDFKDFAKSFGVQIKPPKKASLTDDIKRQSGLALRNTMEGAPALVDLATYVPRFAYSKLSGNPMPYGLSDYMSQGADAMGLPKPQNTGEDFGSTITKTLVGGAPATKLGALSPKLSSFGDNLASQVSGMVTGAAGAEAANQAGLPPWAQGLTGLATGVAGGWAIPKAGSYAGGKVNEIKAKTLTPAKLNKIIDDTIARFQIRTEDMTAQGRAMLREEIGNAIATGKPLNPQALDRLALYHRLGMTPTKGRLTLDPKDVTMEKNNAKIAANMNDSDNSLAAIDSRNNQTLLDHMNRMSRGADDAYDSGSSVINELKSQDNALNEGVNRAFQSLKDSQGRSVQFDAKDFYNRVTMRLAKESDPNVLPESLKNRINSLVEGKVDIGNGQKVPLSFNADEIRTLDRMISNSLKKGGEEAYAARIVREELFNDATVPMRNTMPSGSNVPAPFTPNGMNQYNPNAANVKGLEAKDLIQQARNKARERFKWQDSSPAIKAATNDAPQAEAFIDKYVISKSASIDDMKVLMDTLQSNPHSRQVIRNYVASWLKDKAFNGNSAETATFSADKFKNALNQLGDRKLSMLFTPDELATLKDLQRASKIEVFQPRGSAVNNSNSGALTVGKFLDYLKNAPVVRDIRHMHGNHEALNVSKALTPEVMQHTLDPKMQLLYQGLIERNKQ